MRTSKATQTGSFLAQPKRFIVASSLALFGIGLSLFPKTSAALISNDQFFGWVEGKVPQYLGGTLGSITVPNWGQYRGPYPTGNYLGVMNDGGIYVYGPMVGNVLTRLGQVSDFTCQIQNTCQPPPPPPPTRYADKVYALWDSGAVYSVTKSGVTLVKNKTSFTVGLSPLFNCWLATAGGVLDGGNILVSCQDALSANRHYFYLDPVEEAIYNYTGPVPLHLNCGASGTKGWVCPTSTTWVQADNQPPSGAPANTKLATKVADGWYVVKRIDSYRLYFVDSIGNEQQVARLEDVVKYLMTFSY